MKLKDKYIALLALIFLFALFLRAYNLTILPVFNDEAIYIRWSQVMNAVPSLRFMPLSDGKQPLFMWILMFLVNRFSDPLWIGRSISVVSGIGTMVAIFLISQTLFNDKRVSLTASLFWALSPYAIFYDRLALVDSLLTMFVVWAVYFGVVTAKSIRLDTAMLAGMALGFAGLTKSSALIVGLAYPLTYIVANWPKRKKNNWVGKSELLKLIKLISLTLVTYSIALGIYNILRLGEDYHMLSARTLDYIHPRNHVLLNPFDPLIPNLQSIFKWVWGMGPGLIWVFALLYLTSFLKKDYLLLKNKPSSGSAFIFIMFMLPVLINAEYAKVLAPRYVLFTLPFLYIFAALLFSNFETKTKLLKKVLIFGLGLWTTQALLNNYKLLTNPEKAALPRIVRAGYLEEWTAGTGIKEAAEYLVEQSVVQSTDQKIVVGTEGYFGALPDGLQMYLNKFPDIVVIGVGIDLEEIPNSLIESANAGNNTYLLINESRLKFEPNESNMTIIRKYNKSLRVIGTKEYNLYGPNESLILFSINNSK